MGVEPVRCRKHRRSTEEIRGSMEATCGELGRIFRGASRLFWVRACDEGRVQFRWMPAGLRPRRIVWMADAVRLMRETNEYRGPGVSVPEAGPETDWRAKSRELRRKVRSGEMQGV